MRHNCVRFLGAVATSMALLLLAPSSALACSPAPGIDRHAFYAAIERPPYLLWGVSILAAGLWAILLFLARPHAKGARQLALLLAAFAVFQPAWWLDPMRGDCGMLRDQAALVVAV